MSIRARFVRRNPADAMSYTNPEGGVEKVLTTLMCAVGQPND